MMASSGLNDGLRASTHLKRHHYFLSQLSFILIEHGVKSYFASKPSYSESVLRSENGEPSLNGRFFTSSYYIANES
jgi:hypothetical protein